MAFRKIEDGELVGKGNMGQPDTPGVSTSEMQRIMDEIPREIIVPAFNELSDELIAETAAASLGAQVVEGLPEETPATVQGVMEALYSASKAGESNVSEALEDHAGNTNNPHNVTAAQTGAYTKAETDTAINEKVAQIGAGDMSKAVYDPTGQQKDIFAAISESSEGAMQKADYASETPGAVNRSISADDGIKVYAHSKQGSVHNFEGVGENCRALMTGDVQIGDTFTVNGAPVIVENGVSNAIYGKLNGRWVSFFVRDGKLSFFTPSGFCLLWSNPSGSATFAGQKVLFDPAGFEIFIVVFSNSGYRKAEIVRLNQASMLQYMGQYIYQRTVTVQSDGANFGGGSYYQTYGSASPSGYNDGCVPLEIYGLQ